MTDTTGWAEIRVATPLPMEVAGTLMQLIGAAWPDAQVRTDRGRGTFGDDYALTMLVDHRRRPKKVTKKAAQVIVGEQNATRDEADAAGVGDSDFLGFDDGWVSTSAPEELSKFLGGIAHQLIGHYEGAVNYLEWEVHVQPEGEARASYVLSIARSKGQTPGALRTKAEEELADARAQLAAIRALRDEYDGVLVDAPYTKARVLLTSLDGLLGD